MAGGGRRRGLDREELQHRSLMTWFKAISAESQLFRCVVNRDKARRVGDAGSLAELDQLAAGFKDELKSARERLRRLRGRLRRARLRQAASTRQ